MSNDKVDWTAAPSAAIAWTYDAYGEAQWICVTRDSLGRWHHHSASAPDFGYQGYYADSLTVRPQE